MRDPTDRWYSQYRFEHVENRDGLHGNTLPFHEWCACMHAFGRTPRSVRTRLRPHHTTPHHACTRPCTHRYRIEAGHNMGHNYYVKTFAGDENPPDDQVLTKKGRKGVPLCHGNFYWTYDKYRGKDGEAKLREWALFARAVDTLRRFHLVLVLELLNDGDDEIARVLDWTAPPRQVLPHEKQAQRSEKASKRARELLDAKVFAKTREHNVLDHLFYHVGRRIFLERYACAAKDADAPAADGGPGASAEV